MKTKAIYFVLLSVFLFACTGNKKNIDTTEQTTKPEPKILIAYYSQQGNTKAVAEQIFDKFGGDLFEIQLETPYPADEKETIEIVNGQRETYYRPALSNQVENMADYDIVFIGTPIWYSTAALPVFSFVESYDFSGKTIIPFYTCGGGGEGTFVADIKVTCGNAEFLESFGTTRSERQEGLAVEKIEQHLASLQEQLAAK